MTLAFQGPQALAWVQQQQHELRTRATDLGRATRAMDGEAAWRAVGMRQCAELGLAPQLNRDVWLAAYEAGRRAVRLWW